jgi:hypothetical protein
VIRMLMAKMKMKKMRTIGISLMMVQTYSTLILQALEKEMITSKNPSIKQISPNKIRSTNRK